jgi:hypothetical protein
MYNMDNDLNNVHKIYNDFSFMADLSRMRKLLVHYYLFNETKNIPGNICEFGVFNGSSLFQFLKFKKIFIPNSQKKIVGFDFFDNEVKIENKDDSVHMNELYKSAHFEGKSLEHFYEQAEKLGFIRHKDVEFVVGDVTYTLTNYLKDKPGFRISLLHMDLDVGEPTYYVLNKLKKYLIPGSIIVFDEYNLDKWTESDGVDLFLKENPSLKLEQLSFAEYPSAIIRINNYL